MNPDILTEPSFALMSRFSKVVWVKGSVKMSEFFVGASAWLGYNEPRHLACALRRVNASLLKSVGVGA